MASWGSGLTGVVGGLGARTDNELARDLVRDSAAVELLGFALERTSDPERALSRSETREESASCEVKNCRIWLLRLFRSSRVIPSEKSNWEIGDTCGLAMA